MKSEIAEISPARKRRRFDKTDVFLMLLLLGIAAVVGAPFVASR